MEKLMTMRELVKFTGLPHGTLRKWLDRGIGPKALWTPGGHRRFRKDDVIAWHNELYKSTKPGCESAA